MNRLLVWFIGLLAQLWRLMGADTTAVKLIVGAKLKVSDRTLVFTASGQKKKNSTWAQILSYLVLVVVGVIALLPILRMGHLPSALSISYVFTAVYLALFLIMELGESIFDTRDVTLLLSRPISSQTFSLARGLFIFTYAAKATLAMSLVPFVALAVVAPWQLPVFFVANLALVTIVVVGILNFYQFLLRVLSPDAFKGVIGAVQMVLNFSSVMIYLLPSLVDRVELNLENLKLVSEPVGFLLPTAWLAAWHDLLSGEILTYAQAGLGLGLLITAGLIYRAQSEGYTVGMLSLLGSRSAAQTKEELALADARTVGNNAENSTSWGDRLAVALTRAGVERASFYYHWAMMLRSRAYKIKVYPALIFAPVFVILFVLRDAFSGDGELSRAALLGGLYYMAFTIITPLINIRITDKPEAAWVWSVHPLPDRGSVAYGQYVAVLGQFFLPTLLIVVPLFIYQGGWGVLPDICIAMGVCIITGAFYQAIERTLPFSITKDGNTGGAILVFLGVGALVTVAFGVHYGLSYVPHATYAAIVVVWAVAFFSLRGLRQLESGFK